MNKVAFTSIATNYLPKARVLAHSIKRHASDVSFVLIVAEPFEKSLLRADDPFDRIITISELGIPDLNRWVFMHSVVETCTAIKGMSLVKLLEATEDTAVVYFDPDIVVTHSLEGLFAEFQDASILLTPHGVEPETELRAIIDNELSHLRYGVYNLGFVAVRNTKSGQEFARWWAQRLHDFCFDDIESGLFTDQRWVDLAPGFFQGVKILRDPGYNVATWNLSHRVITGSLNTGLRVNDRPLVFYHFSGFDSGAMETMLAAYGQQSPVLQQFRQWYIEECERMEQSELGALPWAYSTFDNGEPIMKGQRRLYRLRNDLQTAFNDPFSTRAPKSSYLHWFRHHAHGGSGETPLIENDYQIIVVALDALDDVESSLTELLARTANRSKLTIVSTADVYERLAKVAPGIRCITAAEEVSSGQGREAWILAQIAACKASGLILVQLGLQVPDLWDLRLQVGAMREPSIVTASPLYDGVSLTALATPEVEVNDSRAEDIDRVIFNLDNRMPLESPDFLYECFYVVTTRAQSVLDACTRTESGKERRVGFTAFARECLMVGFSHVILNDLYVGLNPTLGHRAIVARRFSASYEEYEQRNTFSGVRTRYNEVVSGKTADLPTVVQRSSRRHLHISHAWGGGLAHWIRSYCVSDTEHVNMVLRPIGGRGAYGNEMELYADIDAPSPVARWQLPLPIKATTPGNLSYKRMIEKIVSEYGIDVVFVSSLIGHSLDVLKTGVTTFFICHDFFPLTPEIYIRSRHLSGSRVVNFSIDEVYDRGANILFPNLMRAEAKAASRAFTETLAQRHVRLVAPSPSTRQIYLDLVPGLRSSDISVIPHGTVSSTVTDPRPAYSPEGRLRIVIPGRIAPEKGSSLLASVLPDIGEFADVLLVGSGLEGQSLADIAGVQEVSKYQPDELPRIMRDFQPHLGLLLSDFPETFSYTLDELQAMGIPPVAVRIGAFADRIREGENGFLVDNNPQAVVMMLQSLDDSRARLVGVRRTLETANLRTEADMIRDYEGLLDLPRFSARAINALGSLPASAYLYITPSMRPKQEAGPSLPETTHAVGSELAHTNDASALLRTVIGNLRERSNRPRPPRRLDPQEYRKLVSRIRQVADMHLPSSAIVAVVSKGDENLLLLRRQRACHFPQVRGGVYAGHYPANNVEAIEHLEELRARGVKFLLFPITALWWLDHYVEFKRHLETNYKRLFVDKATCLIYELSNTDKSSVVQDEAHCQVKNESSTTRLPELGS